MTTETTYTENPMQKSSRDDGEGTAKAQDKSSTRNSTGSRVRRGRERHKSLADKLMGIVSVESVMEAMLDEEEKHEESPEVHIIGAEQVRPLIFDGVSASINPRVFVTQFFLQLFPWLFWPFQSYMREKLYPMGFELHKVTAEERASPHVVYYLTFFGNIIAPLAFTISCISLTFFDDTQFRVNVVSGMPFIPMTFMVLHRLTVALKYATMNESEYTRFMSCKDFIQASIYQGQMQLLSSWNVSRTDLLLRYELEAACARTGMSTTHDAFFIPIPGISKRSLYYFKQWQAFLSVTHDVGMFDNTVHSSLADIVLEHRDASGTLLGYKVNASVVANKVLQWVDLCDTSISRRYMYLNGLLITSIIFTPLLRLPFVWKSFMLHASAKDISLFFVIFLCSTLMMGLSYSVLQFFVCMIQDTARRGLIAAILKDMVRTHEIPTDLETTQVSLSKTSRRMLARLSNIKMEYIGKYEVPSSVTMIDMIIDAGLDKPLTQEGKEKWVLSRPDLIEDMRKYEANKHKKSTSVVEEEDMTGATAEDIDLFSDELQDAFVDDMRWSIPDISKFLGRVPSLDVTQYARMNILSWTSLRVTFKSFGERYKLRMDGMSVFLFFTFVTILLTITILLINAGDPSSSSGDDENNVSSYQELYSLVRPTSVFSIQSVLAASAVTFLLLGNVAEAAATNDKFDSHLHTVNLHVIQTECEIARIDTILRKKGVHSGALDDSDDDEVEVMNASEVSSIDPIPIAGRKKSVSVDNRRSNSTLVKDVWKDGDQRRSELVVTETGAINSKFEMNAFSERSYEDLEKIARIDPSALVDRKRYLSEFRKTLRSTAIFVEGTDRDRPVSIMGITATWTLYCSILTGLMSLAVTLASQFTNRPSSST